MILRNVYKLGGLFGFSKSKCDVHVHVLQNYRYWYWYQLFTTFLESALGVFVICAYWYITIFY